jgi:hypothetical protein
MKNKDLLLLLIVGMALVIGGAFFKLMDLPGYNFLLIAGMFTEVIALGKLVIRSLKAPTPPNS